MQKQIKNISELRVGDRYDLKLHPMGNYEYKGSNMSLHLFVSEAGTKVKYSTNELYDELRGGGIYTLNLEKIKHIVVNLLDDIEEGGIYQFEGFPDNPYEFKGVIMPQSDKGSKLFVFPSSSDNVYDSITITDWALQDLINKKQITWVITEDGEDEADEIPMIEYRVKVLFNEIINAPKGTHEELLKERMMEKIADMVEDNLNSSQGDWDIELNENELDYEDPRDTDGDEYRDHYKGDEA